MGRGQGPLSGTPHSKGFWRVRNCVLRSVPGTTSEVASGSSLELVEKTGFREAGIRGRREEAKQQELKARLREL